MKSFYFFIKHSFLVAGLLVTFCSVAQTTNIPDANFEQALIDEGIDSDGIVNGTILTADAEAVINLNVKNKNIVNLSGIEAFVSLQILDCSQNKLEILELTTNNALRELRCYQNRLTSLDVSSTNTLEFLKANHNSLTTIVIGEQPVLDRVELYTNELTTVDVSQCRLLTYFTAYDNKITHINVTHNQYLTALGLSFNNLSEINLANNIYLEILDVSVNTISKLDIRFNNELRELKFIDNSISNVDLTACPNLTALYGSNNKLTTINASNITNLRDVRVSDNLLTSLNLTGTGLTFLEARNNPLLEFICVDDATSATATITSIDAHTSFTEDCSNLRASSYIADSNFEQKLIELEIDSTLDNVIYHSDAESVTSLNVAHSNISDLTGIEAFQNLTYLLCNDNLLTSIDLQFNSNLESLFLDDNQLNELSLFFNTNLQTLTAKNNNITYLDVRFCNNLQVLSLTHNPLVNLQMESNVLLRELRLGNTRLEALDLSNKTELTLVHLSGISSLTSLNIKNGTNTAITEFTTTSSNNLYCIQVDDPAYSIANWTRVSSNSIFRSDCSVTIAIAPKVFLAGALVNPNTGEEHLMRDDFRAQSILSTESYYNTNITCDTSVFTVTGENAIVDWVEVHVLNSSNLSNSLYKCSALLQRDGDIVDVDGTSSITLPLDPGSYSIAVYHRNHIPIASNAINIAEGSAQFIDLTVPANVVGTTNALSEIQTGMYALFAGNVWEDDLINESDINNISRSLGYAGKTYKDVDMNGQVQTTDIFLTLQFLGKEKQF